MPLPDDLRFRPAVEADLPAIAAMRDAVGWAAHEWALRVVLDLPDARCLLAVDRAGRIVAVGSGVAYGRLGVIGNMVVAEDHRRRGIGAAVLQSVIDFLDERGCTRLELSATPAGRPLYARHGFEHLGPSAMATIPRTAPLDPDPVVTVSPSDEVGAIAAYDAPRFGGDRRRVLAMLAADRSRPFLVASENGQVAGYTWLRADGPRLGPFIADEPRIAAALLAAAFQFAPWADALTVNIPLANIPGSGWLRRLGVALEPRDGRMGRGAPIERRDDTIYSNLVGALG
jgi:GNAT superfamily N-acetyltransferase